MDLKQLQYFVRVAELGGFTRASVELTITQPALSKQIRQLEVELRQTLFHRNGRGISLTPEGKTLFAHAKGILEQVDRARQDLREQQGSPTGKVVLGITPSAGKILAPNMITTFRQRFARASLEIIEGKSWTIHDWLTMGRIDIGVLYDPPDSPMLSVTPLMHEEVCLVQGTSRNINAASQDLRFSDLKRFPLILPSLPHTMRVQVEAGARRAGIELNVVLNIEGADFILELVRQGHGCTILPHHLVIDSGFSEQLQVSRFTDPPLTRTLAIAISNQRPSTRLARETAVLVQKSLQDGYPYGV